MISTTTSTKSLSLSTTSTASSLTRSSLPSSTSSTILSTTSSSPFFTNYTTSSRKISSLSSLTSIPISGSSSVVSPTIAFTTSTVYATSIYTVVECPASVTHCPIGSTTDIISLYITICPVTATETGKGVPNSSSSPSGMPTSSAPAGEEYTTSTVYSTRAYTITSCAPTVTNCPAKIGSVTTETIALYTTIYPVKPSLTPQPPSGFTISTVYTTNIYTITKCPSTITNCPVGSVTTEVISLYTTICPVTQSATNTVLASQPNGVPARPVSTLLSAAVLPTQGAPAAGRASISVASPAVLSTVLPVGASTLGAWRNASSTSTSTGPEGTVGTFGVSKSSTTYTEPTANSGAGNGGIGTSLVLVIAMLAIVL
jgi:chitinase